MERTRYKIFLVDDNIANLTAGKNILRMFYEVFTLSSGAKLFELLAKVMPDLILLDVEMPEMDGYEVIQKLKSNEAFSWIPVIFLTGKNDEDSELNGLSLGAVDYVSKPFSPKLLLKRLENHLAFMQQKKQLQNYAENLEEMVRQKTTQIMDLQNAVLTTVTDMVEFRDNNTGGHVGRTQKYLELLVTKMLEEKVYAQETSTWNMEYLLPSAQLHDVGKIAISDAILNKPGKLTEEEFNEMKKHTSIGVEAVERIENNTAEHAFLYHAKIIAGTHHEKWDGTGYPLGLSGLNIPLEGRLVAIVDVYDALISKRAYKKAFSLEEAEGIIKAGKGKHFDPILVEVFLKVAGQFAEIAKEYEDAGQ